MSNDALKRACYTVRFLFADRPELRSAYFKNYGRFALVAIGERTTQIPEFSDLDSSWDTRARGFGGTPERPVSLGAEENALCMSGQTDQWYEQDILIHEYVHGLHLLGASGAIDGFDDRLESLFQAAIADNKWTNTYSLSSKLEYLVGCLFRLILYIIYQFGIAIDLIPVVNI